jgi:hypothetical protein
MNSPADHDLVQAYLDGTLGPEQTAAVEQRVRGDPRFADLVMAISREEAIFVEWASAKKAGVEARRNGFLRVAKPQPARPSVVRRVGRFVAVTMMAASAVAAAVAFLQLGLPPWTPRPNNGEKLVAVQTQPEVEPALPVYATVGDIQGDVYVVSDKGESVIAQPGQKLTLGQRLQTRDGSFATLELADSTRLDVNDNTTIQLLSAGPPAGPMSPDKALADFKVFLQEGSISPVTPEGPPKANTRPVVVATPHVAEARPMPGSTRSTITANAKGTRIEQERGKMSVKRTKDTQAVDVASGFVALAPAAGNDPLASQPIPKPTSNARLVLKDVGNVHQAAYSHDGNVIAAGANEGNVKLWNIAGNGLPMPNLKVGGKGQVKAIAYSPDGMLFAAALDDKTVKLFAVASAREVGVLKGSKHPITSLAFAPNGHLLAAGGSGNKGGEIKVWNVHTHVEVATLPGNGNGTLSVAFGHDSRTLASAGKDNAIKIWDVASRQLKQTLTGHTAQVNSVAFSPDGLTLASGGKDLTVRLWDPVSGVERRTLLGMGAEVRAVAFSPDGKTLAAADHSVRLWDLATGTPLGTFMGHKNAIYSVAFSPKGKDIATAGSDKTIRIWDLSTLRPAGGP